MKNIGYYEKDDPNHYVIPVPGAKKSKTTLNVKNMISGKSPYSVFYSMAMKLDEIVNKLNELENEYKKSNKKM